LKQQFRHYNKCKSRFPLQSFLF